MRTLEGKMIAKGIRIGIVVSRFNEFITSKLLGGAMDGLLRHDVSEDNVDVAWVPGAFEIPLIASKMAGSAGHVRHRHDREYRAGDRARRNEGRQQGL